LYGLCLEDGKVYIPNKAKQGIPRTRKTLHSLKKLTKKISAVFSSKTFLENLLYTEEDYMDFSENKGQGHLEPSSVSDVFIDQLLSKKFKFT
jgi:hypothetical protein